MSGFPSPRIDLHYEPGREQCSRKIVRGTYLAHSRTKMIETLRPPGELSWID
jgi:hypothetical protein